MPGIGRAPARRDWIARNERAAARCTGTRLDVKAVPKASRDQLAGWTGGLLEARATALPERGKANAAVIAVVAALGLPRGRCGWSLAGQTKERYRRASCGLVSPGLWAVTG